MSSSNFEAFKGRSFWRKAMDGYDLSLLWILLAVGVALPAAAIASIAMTGLSILPVEVKSALLVGAVAEICLFLLVAFYFWSVVNEINERK